MDDDDDDDMGSPPMESSMPRESSLPPHMQNQSYMRTAASSSPPIPNGVPIYQRSGTPQAAMISRPDSRNAGRRASSNIGPSHLQQVSQPGPNQNGYPAYVGTPPMHLNQQAPQRMPSAPFTHQHSQGQATYYHQLQQAASQQVQQAQQAYMQQDQRRQSLPSFSHPDRQRQHLHVPSPPQPGELERRSSDDGRMKAPAKSRSIFTPVDDSRSLLAQQWGSSKTTAVPKPEIKEETAIQAPRRDSEVSRDELPRTRSPPGNTQIEVPPPQRSDSSEFAPPSRSDSQSGAKRPRLKVQIPEEQSDSGSPATGSSPRKSETTPPKASTEASHSSGTGVHLPPPSPSDRGNAVLSAGAQGPPNPFARPAPPPMGTQAKNDSIETPISALPSRFMADQLLPSPSSFYPDWAFGRSGGESANILPSPLNFGQTPVHNGPLPGRESLEPEKKRKSPENQTPQEETMKRIKT